MLGVGGEGGVDVPLIFSSFVRLLCFDLAMSGNVALVCELSSLFKLGG